MFKVSCYFYDSIIPDTGQRMKIVTKWTVIMDQQMTYTKNKLQYTNAGKFLQLNINIDEQPLDHFIRRKTRKWRPTGRLRNVYNSMSTKKYSCYQKK